MNFRKILTSFKSIIYVVVNKTKPNNKTVFKIRTAEYMYKITEPLEINWAFIQPSNLGAECKVKFVNNALVLFDEMTFEHTAQAYIELERNGFINDDNNNDNEFETDEMMLRYNAQTYSELNNKYPDRGIPEPPLPPFYNKLGENPIYSSGESFISPTRIKVNSDDYWVKATCFEFLTLECALVERKKDGKFKVFFIRDNSYIFDIMDFDSIKEVKEGLTRNGFERHDSITKSDNIERHGNNKRLHELALNVGGISLPEQPFKEDKIFFTGGYSSGGGWK